MRTKQKLSDTGAGQREAILRTMFEGTKVFDLGSSKAIILPAAWVRLYGMEVDGKIWVTLNSTPGELTVKPIDKDEALSLMEKNNVKPR